MDENENKSRKVDNIEAVGTAQLGQDSPIACISIIGQIEGHMVLPEQSKSTKYEHILPLLVDIEQNEKVKGFLLVLNTVGGDVEAGLAIAEMVAGMRKPSVSLVIGGGHSIGVPLAVCTRRSFIVPSATMTLHPVRISGMVINAPQSIDYLRQMQARVVNFVCGHSNLPTERFYQMLEAREDMANDVGTILDGEAAVRCGLIDAVGGLGDALEALNGLVERSGEEAR
ncbi:MAG: ATP-dependent Clp protease proteolytic subunit [Candidatus Spyradocola sp.]|nr:ATP-dependent Clp protease proteolytic subunit [Candidatus Spyradocola sp.]